MVAHAEALSWHMTGVEEALCLSQRECAVLQVLWATVLALGLAGSREALAAAALGALALLAVMLVIRSARCVRWPGFALLSRPPARQDPPPRSRPGHSVAAQSTRPPLPSVQIRPTDSPAIVARKMESQPKNAAVRHAGCVALRDRYAAAGPSAVPASAVEAVICALGHTSAAEDVHTAVSALHTMAGRNGSVVREHLARPAPAVCLLSRLQRSAPDDAALASTGLALLAAVADGASTAQAAALCDGNAVALVLTALDAHFARSEVACEGFRAIEVRASPPTRARGASPAIPVLRSPSVPAHSAWLTRRATPARLLCACRAWMRRPKPWRATAPARGCRRRGCAPLRPVSRRIPVDAPRCSATEKAASLTSSSTPCTATATSRASRATGRRCWTDRDAR